MRSLLLATLAFVSIPFVSFAADEAASFDASTVQAAAMAEAARAGLNWKVGDTASYKISVGGFINGTSVSQVREDVGDGFWMQQDMDLGFAGKQKIEILFNKADGAIRKLPVNGKEETPPDSSEMEVVEMKESSVQVPAGSFQCIYVKLRNKKSNEMQEAWVNPRDIPMSGVIKSLGNSQLGKVTQELTSFKRN